VKAAGLTGIHLVDSASASFGVGLLALRAAELAESGWKAADVARELERLRGQSGCLVTVDPFDNLIRSGRVTRGKAWLAGMLDVKPILSLDVSGRIQPVDRVRGGINVVPKVLSLLDKRLTPRPGPSALGRARGSAGSGGAGPHRPGGGISASGLLRLPGHGRAGYSRGCRSLGRVSI
jgi:DegV family protein with EDD domain